MKVLIDIPEEEYKCVQITGHIGNTTQVSNAILNGAPLNTQSNIRLTNSEWINFLCEHFEISRTSAKEMLHAMMSVKREDNFKKQFSGRKRG